MDDEGKDDKAYLPLELKQNEEHQRSCSNINVKAWRNECFFLDWNEETKDFNDTFKPIKETIPADYPKELYEVA